MSGADSFILGTESFLLDELSSGLLQQAAERGGVYTVGRHNPLQELPYNHITLKVNSDITSCVLLGFNPKLKCSSFHSDKCLCSNLSLD